MPDRLGDAFVIEPAHPSISVDAERLAAVLRHAADREQAAIDTVTIVLTDHATVRHLNRTYLSHDYDTDVLSFPLHADAASVIEGEVYVDLDTALERHGEFGATLEEEVARYAVHGLLHLLGYSDHTPEGKQRMRALEDEYLRFE